MYRPIVQCVQSMETSQTLDNTKLNNDWHWQRWKVKYMLFFISHASMTILFSFSYYASLSRLHWIFISSNRECVCLYVRVRLATAYATVSALFFHTSSSVLKYTGEWITSSLPLHHLKSRKRHSNWTFDWKWLVISASSLSGALVSRASVKFRHNWASIARFTSHNILERLFLVRFFASPVLLSLFVSFHSIDWPTQRTIANTHQWWWKRKRKKNALLFISMWLSCFFLLLRWEEMLSINLGHKVSVWLTCSPWRWLDCIE